MYTSSPYLSHLFDDIIIHVCAVHAHAIVNSYSIIPIHTYVIIIKMERTMLIANIQNIWKTNKQENKCLILPMVIKSVDY